MWLRVMTLLCVCLLWGASTAQACHAHDDAALTTKSSPVNVPTDHCPLCLAMHTALPSADQSAPFPMQQLQEVARETWPPGRSLSGSFSLFSRPPPAPARDDRRRQGVTG